MKRIPIFFYLAAFFTGAPMEAVAQQPGTKEGLNKLPI